MSVTFEQFLTKFPPVEAPITLGEDDHHIFSTENETLSLGMIAAFIQPIEETPEDEFTEYVPCFALPGTEGFVALVYWKAALLTYEYILVTYTHKGQAINRRVIAKTVVSGEKVTRSVANIDAEMVITVAEGVASTSNDDYDPSTTKNYNFEILPNGEIIVYNAMYN